MNIFILHQHPQTCAEQLCDKHLVKMIAEHTQILSTNARLAHAHSLEKITQMDEEGWPKKTHENHPCTVWARDNSNNRLWLRIYTAHMLLEYTKRYGKVHAYSRFYTPNESFHTPPDIDNFAIAMPLEIKFFAAAQYKDRSSTDVAVLAYRLYYLVCKSHILTWKNGYDPRPLWLQDEPQLDAWASRLQAVLASDEFF
jgi:hypothetical protein